MTLTRRVQLASRLCLRRLGVRLCAPQFVLGTLQGVLGAFEILLGPLPLGIRPPEVFLRAFAFGLGPLEICLGALVIRLRLLQCRLGAFAIGVRASALVPCLPPQMSGASAWQVAQTLPSLISSADCASAVAGKNSTEQETKTAANSRAAGAATALSLFTSRLLHSSRRPPGRAAAGERTVREFASLGDRAILDQGLTLA